MPGVEESKGGDVAFGACVVAVPLFDTCRRVGEDDLHAQLAEASRSLRALLRRGADSRHSDPLLGVKRATSPFVGAESLQAVSSGAESAGFHGDSVALAAARSLLRVQDYHTESEGAQLVRRSTWRSLRRAVDEPRRVCVRFRAASRRGDTWLATLHFPRHTAHARGLAVLTHVLVPIVARRMDLCVKW